jgi:hypothetical protein
LRFKYELTGRGWVSGFIEMNSNTFYFATSYITDALDEMLKALILLNPELSPFPVSNSQFEWNEEPGGTVWKFRKIDDLLHVEIMSFENLQNKKQLVIGLNESCSITEFSEAVVQALDLLLSLHGKEGYKEKWVNYDFPTNNYLKLKGFVTKKN